MSYKITRKLHFECGRRTKKKIAVGEKPKRPKARTPRVSKLMALAIYFDKMLNDGHIKSMAEIARRGFVTRARMTQIMNLLLLAPDIQEEILCLPETTEGLDPVSTKEAVSLASEPDWHKQREKWGESFGRNME
ncbi:hypothetical protein STSP2_01115 [Anaerohalosphaera lusitana]|uniref:Uncharacterized protein n=1 Tax=Anaerohalosphaera lusitana TaxID=1936003 RepID=A0A1U9NJ54_9BACT|nr:hypothetical protein [Anaerohalosphaera lusitana]AQT67963.1 hypothetical protein STSP2_01115 [Anaerohalosphaera lusitana]